VDVLVEFGFKVHGGFVTRARSHFGGPQNLGKDSGAYPEAREAGRTLVSVGTDAAGCEIFIYVNNRLEGNALETIDAMLEAFHA
jgi:hypothetical protein